MIEKIKSMDEELLPPPKEKKGETERQKRLGAALRENLRKRKAQNQQREETNHKGFTDSREPDAPHPSSPALPKE